MHRVSIAFAFVAGVFAYQACLAQSQPLYNFVKANTSDEQFRHDRDECVARATTVEQGYCSSKMIYAPLTPGGPPQLTPDTRCYSPRQPARSTSTYGFLNCMLAKGYQRSAPSMPAGKPGLYELHKFSNLAIFSQRDLPDMLPQAQRRASAEALARPGPVFQLCVAQDGEQQLGAVAGLSSSCTHSNVVNTQHGFSADARCPGGQFTRVTFEATAPDRSEFTVIRQPMPKAAVRHIEKYQINWISPDCGDIPPRTVRSPDGKLVAMPNPQPPVKSFATTLP
jgi:hypothetical protein